MEGPREEILNTVLLNLMADTLECLAFEQENMNDIQAYNRLKNQDTNRPISYGYICNPNWRYEIAVDGQLYSCCELDYGQTHCEIVNDLSEDQQNKVHILAKIWLNNTMFHDLLHK